MGEAGTQGDRVLNKGDFASKTDALGSVARQSGETSHTKDLAAGRAHGARRDGKSGRKCVLRLGSGLVFAAWICPRLVGKGIDFTCSKQAIR